MSHTKYTFTTYKDKAGEYRWRLRAPNGRTMADSAEGYTRRAAARHALGTIIRAVLAGRWKWAS